MFKRIAAFLKVKTDSAMIKNMSVQEQYESAALQIIQEIKKLRQRHVEAKGEIVRFRQIAKQKDEARAKVDSDILTVRKTSPKTDVSTRVKLALIHKHSAVQFRKKADALEEMLVQIEDTVRLYSDKRDDLAIRLELIRETKAAREAGLENVDDVLESAAMLDIDIDTILSEVQVFKGDDTTAVNIGSSDMEDYLSQLEAQY